MTRLLLSALVLAGCSGISEPDVTSTPVPAAQSDDLAGLAAQVAEDDRVHVALQGAAYDGDGLAPLVRLVPAGSELAGVLAESFCAASGDPEACSGRVDRYTRAVQEAGLEAEVVGVVQVAFDELFAGGGPGPCPPKPKKSEPGPSPALDGRAVSVVDRVLAGGELVGVVEVYGHAGERPELWEGEVGADQVAPVGVGARGPLAPAEYGPMWAEANAEVVRAGYFPMPDGPCCLCIPDPRL